MLATTSDPLRLSFANHRLTQIWCLAKATANVETQVIVPQRPVVADVFVPLYQDVADTEGLETRCEYKAAAQL